MNIAELLKQLRNELNITQEDLAHAVHVSFSTVNRWENKKSQPNRMAHALILDYCIKSKVSDKIVTCLKSNK